MSDIGTESPNVNPPKAPEKMTRRTFLQRTATLLGGAIAATALPDSFVRAQSAPAEPTTETALAQTQVETEAPIAKPIPGDAIIPLDSRNEVIKRTLINPDAGEVQSAALEEEPISTILKQTEGTDEEGDAFKEYQVQYNDEIFTVKVKTITSTRYHDLNKYFNSDANRIEENYKEKPITVMTYDSSKPTTEGLSAVTLYCLQSFQNGDGIAVDQDALLPDYYEQKTDENNPQLTKNTLKEDWTVRQFAEAFYPSAISKISDNTSLETYNKLLAGYNLKQTKNATVVISNWFAHGDQGYAIEPDLPSDNGARFTPSPRLPEERYMHLMTGVFAHEMRHNTEPVVARNGLSYHTWISYISRDKIKESFAEMSNAGCLVEIGQSEIAENMYKLQAPFMPENGEFNFGPYNPTLPAIVLAPYAKTMAAYFQEEFTDYDEAGAITLEGLAKTNRYYMKIRDDFLANVDMEWYGNWHSDKLNDLTWSDKLIALNHLDLYAPLIFADKKIKGEPIPEDKTQLIQEIMDRSKTEALQTRASALEQSFSESQKEMAPYFQDVFTNVMSLYVNENYSTVDFPKLQSPDIENPVVFSRPRDAAYEHQDDPSFYESDYRTFHPMYHFTLIEPAPDKVQYKMKQTASTEDYVVVLKYASTDGKLTTQVLQPDKEIILDKTKRALVCFLDKRTNQVVDDISGNMPEIFTVSAEEYVAPPPPPPEQQNLYIPKVAT